MVATCAWDLLDETFGAKFRQVITQGAELVIRGGDDESFGNRRMDFSRGEVITRSNVREANEGVHECELAWMIKLELRYSIAEGFTHRSANDKIRFFNRAEGSVEERSVLLDSGSRPRPDEPFVRCEPTPEGIRESHSGSWLLHPGSLIPLQFSGIRAQPLAG